MIVEIRSFRRAKDFRPPTFEVNVIRSDTHNGNHAEGFCDKHWVNYALGKVFKVKFTRLGPGRQGSEERQLTSKTRTETTGDIKLKSVGKVQTLFEFAFYCVRRFEFFFFRFNLFLSFSKIKNFSRDYAQLYSKYTR